MMYDISDPANASFNNYINTRNFAEDPSQAGNGTFLTGDVAPEGLYFISSEISPSRTPILLAAFEVSGTVAAYSVGCEPSGHHFDTEWSFDSQNHWHVCTICGTKADIAAHRFKNGICIDCGAKKNLPSSGDITDTPGSETDNGAGNTNKGNGVTDSKKKQDIVKTGDDFNQSLLLLLPCAGFLAMASALLLVHKKDRKH